MHSCYSCGCACYCGGDIDHCDVGDDCREGCGCDEDDDDFADPPGADDMSDDTRWQPAPVPQGDGRHDIGDDVRAAIVERLISDWSQDRDLTPEKARQLAMWAGASVRALLHELGTLRDMTGERPQEPTTMSERTQTERPREGYPIGLVFAFAVAIYCAFGAVVACGYFLT